MLQHRCEDELRGLSLKATPARIAVLKLLEGTNEPLDVLSIKGYLARQRVVTNPVTIFRIVNTFTDKGITKQIQFNDGKSRYELAKK